MKPILSSHHSIDLDEYELYKNDELTSNDIILDNNNNNNNNTKIMEPSNSNNTNLIDLNSDCEKFSGMSLVMKRKL